MLTMNSCTQRTHLSSVVDTDLQVSGFSTRGGFQRCEVRVFYNICKYFLPPFLFGGHLINVALVSGMDSIVFHEQLFNFYSFLLFRCYLSLILLS